MNSLEELESTEMRLLIYMMESTPMSVEHE